MKTRQSKMYQARVADGLCAQCGKEPLVTAIHCQGCRETHNKRMREGFRKRNGSGIWVPGGRGRPPLGDNINLWDIGCIIDYLGKKLREKKKKDE